MKRAVAAVSLTGALLVPAEPVLVSAPDALADLSRCRGRRRRRSVLVLTRP